MIELLSNAELDRIAGVLQRGPYEGYPSPENRLHIGAVTLHNEVLLVPDGPWHVKDHVNRRGKSPTQLDPEVPNADHSHVAPELSDRWQQSGLLLDQYGRPIHPYWQQLLKDPRIGLPTGAGFFWRYGPNGTADPVVYRQQGTHDNTELLLIQRLKGKQWALPGGFVDRTDASPAEAARREAQEETHLDKRHLGRAESIMEKRSVGLRDTLHAWTENVVVLFHGDQEYLHDVKPIPGDDAVDVGWFTRDEIANLDVFDAHAQYIDMALKRLALA